MKKLFTMLLVLFTCYVGIQTAIRVFGHGYTTDYKISTKNNTFKIHEVYLQRYKNNNDNYYFEIKSKKTVFSFSTYYNFKRKGLIIKKIESYKDSEYECILPIFKGNKIITDVMCMKDNIIYPYHTIKNQNKNLDNYIKLIKNYDINKFEDNKDIKLTSSSIKVFKNKIQDKLYFAINNYKGIYLFNNNSLELKKINLFNKDVYKQTILTNINEYYIIANYNETYDFNSIYVINMKNGKKTEILTPEISMDSYIQGSIKNSFYLIDRENKKQYEINIKAKKIIEVGNENIGSKFYDGKKLIEKNFSETLFKKIYFKSNVESINDEGYERVDFVGNKNSGYYYYYKKDNNQYNIYRSSLQSKNNLTYLFSVSNYSQIKYSKDKIYLIEKDKLICYQDQTGKRTIASNSEFEFNDDLHYYIYEK